MIAIVPESSEFSKHGRAPRSAVGVLVGVEGPLLRIRAVNPCFAGF